MKRMDWRWMGVLLVLVTVAAAAPEAPTFDDNPLEIDTHWGGAGSGESAFKSGDWYFPHVDQGWSWEGFVYSSRTDTTTNSYTNDASAITGGGAHGSDNYGVGFIPIDYETPTYETIPQVVTADVMSDSFNAEMEGLFITNTTYAYLDMHNGGWASKKFGGESGDDEDWFKLTIRGIDATGSYTSETVEFYLADFRFEDNTKDYIVDEWTWVDLTDLGPVVGLEFDLSSSDTGAYGMNTPSYFAVDYAPEPATLSVLAMGAVGMLAARKRRKA
jgi:hypothetical protein